MKYIELIAPGSADQMRVSSMPKPEPHADEVLIRVFAAGVNRPDIMQRQGLYPPPQDASSVLGLRSRARSLLAVKM